ncbi:MAG: SAM-dependent methyltransferase [Okeania sp. SIO2C2]|uniref:SAM-dependent methyltransferase n=1 Tax=Okeania sp. SIO2C2 TaxID=2607787 RepID=UPI0013B79E15|nr:SAM-dependent methyltransferase [Okeania sp. SIO2C2]NEP88179.1 SAM-dependent methyltransferase [Okeania sp. SIO2C2]
MTIKLEKIVPWGRNLDEYISMFDLTPEEKKLKILDCAAGPSSFNYEMTFQRYNVISCDPIYKFSADEISQRIQATSQNIIDQVKANYDTFVWQNLKSPENLLKVRMAAMEKFLLDFPNGFQQKRYLTAELPKLPFDNHRFDLALYGHFLFLYSDHLSAEFHLESILEMCRVAKQVRIFPLLKLSGEISPLLTPIIEKLTTKGYKAEIKQVTYEFQKGGNQMLQIFV